MKITCRRQDRERFEKLGFCLEYEESPASPVVEMMDQAANGGDKEKLPTGIPYRGYHDAGSDYGAAAFACDGKELMEVEIGHWGGFVVDWDEGKEEPNSQSLNLIRNYINVRKAVDAFFQTLSPSKPGEDPDA